jgi:hypothetical protein
MKSAFQDDRCNSICSGFANEAGNKVCNGGDVGGALGEGPHVRASAETLLEVSVVTVEPVACTTSRIADIAVACVTRSSEGDAKVHQEIFLAPVQDCCGVGEFIGGVPRMGHGSLLLCRRRMNQLPVSA